MNLQVEIRCRLVGALGTLEIPGLVVNDVDVSPQVVLLSEGLVTLVAEVCGAFLPATIEYVKFIEDNPKGGGSKVNSNFFSGILLQSCASNMLQKI
jgi:hypothetical protein